MEHPMTPIMKHIQICAIALAIGLFSVDTARAQVWGGPFPSNGNDFSGLNASTTNGAFGQRPIGGMVTSRGAGTFTGSNDLVNAQTFNMNNITNAGVTGFGFQQSAFVGGGGINNGFVGGLADRGIYANGAVNSQYGALPYYGGQYGAAYGDAVNVLFGGLTGRNNRNNPRNQLAEGQDIRSRRQIPIQVTYNIDFPVPNVSMSNVARKLSNELSSSPTIGAYGPVSVRVEGGTAILRGTVPTDHDRILAAQLALLEPRVSQVRNELQVGSAPTPP
jgi:hypothetical protein